MGRQAMEANSARKMIQGNGNDGDGDGSSSGSGGGGSGGGGRRLEGNVVVKTMVPRPHTPEADRAKLKQARELLDAGLIEEAQYNKVSARIEAWREEAKRQWVSDNVDPEEGLMPPWQRGTRV